jgi:signal transduction histidine kinase
MKKLIRSSYAGRVSICAKRLNDRKIEIILTDNGGGIDNNILDRIFDYNFSTKGSNGNGLGLSIVSMLMSDSFLGAINVSNTAVGTKFSLVFDEKRRLHEDTREL